MNIFQLIFIISILFLLAFTGTQEPKAQQAAKPAMRWYGVHDLEIEGKGWTQTRHFFDRLPSKAENVVRAPVWKLAQNSAGMSVRFITDSSSISVRWTLRSPNLTLWHMPATGVSGVDLYVKHKNIWRWLAVGRAEKPTVNEQLLINNMKPKPLAVSHALLKAVVKKVQPPYPAAALSFRGEGKIVVKILVDRKGNVVEACADNGHPLLRTAARKAALEWKFKENFGFSKKSTFYRRWRFVQSEILFNFKSN